eukprot:4140380-Pyramimonas_sp.AAC.1
MEAGRPRGDKICTTNQDMLLEFAGLVRPRPPKLSSTIARPPTLSNSAMQATRARPLGARRNRSRTTLAFYSSQHRGVQQHATAKWLH